MKMLVSAAFLRSIGTIMSRIASRSLDGRFSHIVMIVKIAFFAS